MFFKGFITPSFVKLLIALVIYSFLFS